MDTQLKLLTSLSESPDNMFRCLSSGFNLCDHHNKKLLETANYISNSYLFTKFPQLLQFCQTAKLTSAETPVTPADHSLHRPQEGWNNVHTDKEKTTSLSKEWAGKTGEQHSLWAGKVFLTRMTRRQRLLETMYKQIWRTIEIRLFFNKSKIHIKIEANIISSAYHALVKVEVKLIFRGNFI